MKKYPEKKRPRRLAKSPYTFALERYFGFKWVHRNRRERKRILFEKILTSENALIKMVTKDDSKE